MPAARPRPFARALRLDHALQRARERRQLDGFARLILRPVRLQPVGLVGRPVLHELQLRADGARGAVAHREAVLGIGNARRRDLRERHRAPLLEHGQRRMQRAGNHGGIETGAVQVLVARQVPVDIDGLRRPALADDRGDLVFLLWIHEHERLAAEAVEVLLEHAAGDERRHAGIKGVAALQENAERGRGGERVTGGHATGRSHHRGPQRRSGGLPILDRHLRASEPLATREQSDGA